MSEFDEETFEMNPPEMRAEDADQKDAAYEEIRFESEHSDEAGSEAAGREEVVSEIAGSEVTSSEGAEYETYALGDENPAMDIVEKRIDTEETVESGWEEYETDLMELCQAKAEEFHLLGYEEVTAQEIWTCVQSLTKGSVPLHEMVAAVLGLQVGKFMNYTTMNAFKGIFDGGSFDAANRA